MRLRQGFWRVRRSRPRPRVDCFVSSNHRLKVEWRVHSEHLPYGCRSAAASLESMLWLRLRRVHLRSRATAVHGPSDDPRTWVGTWARAKQSCLTSTACMRDSPRNAAMRMSLSQGGRLMSHAGPERRGDLRRLRAAWRTRGRGESGSASIMSWSMSPSTCCMVSDNSPCQLKLE